MFLKVQSILNKVDKGTLFIANITMVVMMTWIVLDVFLRFVFNKPLAGTIELTGEYFMVVIVYLAISATEKTKGNPNINFLIDRLPEKINRIVNFSTRTITAIIFVYFAYLNLLEGLDHFDRGIVSSGILNYPLWPAFITIFLGMLILAIRLLLEGIIILIDGEAKLMDVNKNKNENESLDL